MNLPTATNKTNPCRYTATMYTPRFRNDTPTDPPANPDTDAAALWAAFHTLANRGPFYGPHARPCLPEARRSNLLPCCPPGMYTFTGDLATLALGR